MAITADRLLLGLKRRIVTPASQALFTDSDYLAFADDVISSRLVPLLESVNQDFFVYRTLVPLIGGQSEYPIPYRAVGRGLRELKLIGPSGTTRNLALVTIEDAHLYSTSAITQGFYFLGDKLRLVPDVPSSLGGSFSLEMWWRMPPSSLISQSGAGLVTSVAGDTITVANLPSTIIPGVSVDLIQGQSGNTIYALDCAVTNVGGSQLTLTAGSVPASFAPGDFVAIAGQSPVVNFIPNECYSLLESLLAYRVLNSLGDFEGAKTLAEDIAVEERNIKQLLEPRIDGEPTIIINRTGLVRGTKWLQRRWLYGG